MFACRCTLLSAGHSSYSAGLTSIPPPLSCPSPTHILSFLLPFQTPINFLSPSSVSSPLPPPDSHSNPHHLQSVSDGRNQSFIHLYCLPCIFFLGYSRQQGRSARLHRVRLGNENLLLFCCVFLASPLSSVFACFFALQAHTSPPGFIQCVCSFYFRC